MPSAVGQNHHNMEKKKSTNAPASASGESNTFICTECGDGFNHYSNLLAHMAVHGPLDSFSFDGSSNGFEVPREYVLQENGTLTVVNGLSQSNSPMKPLSPGILPSYPTFPVKPLSPTHRPQISPFKPRPSDLNSDKSRQGTYHCEICNRSFNSLQSLHRHQQYRNTERGYKCTLCCKIFEDQNDLKKHLQCHVNEKFHCCAYCGKRFLKVDALKSHQKENHLAHKADPFSQPLNRLEKKPEKMYPCKKCKLNFFWMSDFQTHSQYHCKGKEPDSLFASEIEVEVNSKNPEDTQLEFCHSNGTSVDPKKSESDKILSEECSEFDNDLSVTPYRCGLCGDRFHMLTALKEHHLVHQTQEEIDQLNEESQKDFKRRVPKGRRRRVSNPNGKLHPCKHCQRVFNHSSSLSRHMRYHKGTMHTCVFCGRHFPQRCDLRRHVVMYHKSELDKKPSLKLLYTSTENLPLPRSVEIKKIPDPLENDDKSLSDSEQMIPPELSPIEIRSAKSGRVNYKCQECGKQFGLLCVYQRHLRYHKKEPSRSPSQLSSSPDFDAQNHPNSEQMDDGLMPYKTEMSMDLKQGNEDDYVDHLSKDNGESSEVLYECTECTETFSCLETFLQHQTSHGSETSG